MMLYGDEFNPKYKAQFYELTGCTDDEFTTFMDNLMKSDLVSNGREAVYNHYKGTICGSQTLNVCSFSNLTYSQWLDGGLLKNPLPG